MLKIIHVLALTPPHEAMGGCVLTLYLFLDRPCCFCSYSSGIQVRFCKDQYAGNLQGAEVVLVCIPAAGLCAGAVLGY